MEVVADEAGLSASKLLVVPEEENGNLTSSTDVSSEPSADEKSSLIQSTDGAELQSQEERLLEMDNKEIQVTEKGSVTVLGIIRACLVIVALFVSAVVYLTIFAPLDHLFLRPFSLRISRKVESLMFGLWLSMSSFNFERIIGAKLVFYGQDLPPKERVLVMCNHRTELDWMYLWNLAQRKGRLGSVKYALKSSVRNVPLFGWAFHVLEFLLLDRKWEKDEGNIKRLLSTMTDRRDSLWLVIFPEGTDFSEEKRLKSVEFARQHGLPELNNTLLPRHRGLDACLQALDGSLDAVYDVTIAYKKTSPAFTDGLLGVGPQEVHIHTHRYTLDQVPVNKENGISEWLYKKWEEKDRMLRSFDESGTFPDARFVKPLSLTIGIANIVWFMSSSAAILWQAYLQPWLRVYMLMSATYLALITFLRWRPPTFFSGS